MALAPLSALAARIRHIGHNLRSSDWRLTRPTDVYPITRLAN